MTDNKTDTKPEVQKPKLNDFKESPRAIPWWHPPEGYSSAENDSIPHPPPPPGWSYDPQSKQWLAGAGWTWNPYNGWQPPASGWIPPDTSQDNVIVIRALPRYSARRRYISLFIVGVILMLIVVMGFVFWIF